MDRLQPNGLSSPSGDASGKMDLDAAVRAAVSSSMNAASDSPAREDDRASQDGLADDHGETAPSSDAKGEPGTSTPDKSASPDGQDQAPAADTATLDAPKVWPKDRRGRFMALPDEAKRFVLDLEKAHNEHFTKNAQGNADSRRFADDVRGIFAADSGELQRLGRTEIDVIKAQRNFFAGLNTDPAGTVKKLIANLNLRPDQIFGGTVQSSSTPAPAAEDDEFIDPQVSALKAEVGKITGFLTQAVQHQQAQQLTALEQEVNAFEAEMDGEHSKYPHFAAVFDQMMHLLKTDPQLAAVKATRPREALEKAYQNAVYLNPEIRQQVIEAEFSKRQSERDAQAAAERARIAGTRKGSPGSNGSAVPNGKMSLDEAVKRGMSAVLRQ